MITDSDNTPCKVYYTAL